MFGLGLFYSVERGKCKEPVGLALCPRCHYSLNNGESECQTYGEERRGETPHRPRLRVLKKGGKIEPMKESKAVVLSFGSLLGGSGCLFYLMQNKISCNSNCIFGELTVHRDR